MLTQASRRKKAGVKKTTKRRKSSELSDSTTMPPRRVMADPPASPKKCLQPMEPAPARVTRKNAKLVAATNQPVSPLRKDQDDELQSMDEGSTVNMAAVRMDLSPVTPSVDMNDVFSEEQQHAISIPDQGKFITNAFYKCVHACVSSGRCSFFLFM